jgi:dTDP-4-amino-4,6-dideoxygalactose transaminase
VKLRHLDAWTNARRSRAVEYDRCLRDAEVTTPQEMAYARHVYHIYAVRTPDRAELQRALQSHGVQTGIHYPIPVHLQVAYSDLGYSVGDFPHTERAANEVLSLPMFPELTNSQVEFVAAAVHHDVHAI